MLSTPDCIVVDLIGATPAASLPSGNAKEVDGISALRMLRLQGNPPVTRLVAHLAESSDFNITTEGNRLFIKVRPLSAKAIPQVIEIHPQSAKAIPQTAAPVSPPPAPPAPKPVISSPFSWVEVQDLTVQPGDAGVRIEVSISGPVEPETATLTGPDRIVVDIPDAVPGEGLHPVTVNKNGVLGIRVSRFQQRPPVTRLVVDLSQASSFELLPQRNKLVINIPARNTVPINVPSKAAVEAGGSASAAANTKVPLAAETSSGPAVPKVLPSPNESPADSARAATAVPKLPAGSPETPPEVVGAGPGAPSFLVTKVVTDKSEILSAEEIHNIVSRYEQKRVTQAELAQLIEEFNRLYSAKGFTTARAVLPAQTVHDGVVNVRLIEGRVGKVVVQNQTHTRESYFLNRVPADSGEILKLEEVQGALAYFNATNDVKMHAVLQPGAQFGSTDIVLQTEGPSDLEVTAFSDNAGRDTIGLYRAGVNATYRSLFGNRDPLAMSFLGADGTLGGSGSYSMPLGTRGTRLAALFNYNTIALNGGVLGSTGMVGHSWDAALRLSQPLFMRPATTFSAYLTAHYKTSLLSSEGFPLSHTRVRSLELGTEFQRFDKHGSWFASNVINGGFDDLSGGQEFLRYNGALTRLLQFSPNVTAVFRATGQVSALNPLAPIEQMQIGGAATVRGYPEASLIGDRGYAVTGELNFPFLPNARVKKWIKWAAFVDSGAVYDEGYNGSTKPHDTQLLSSGFGLVFRFSGYMSGRVDFGVPLTNNTGIPAVGVHFYVQSTFDFPRRWPAPPTIADQSVGVTANPASGNASSSPGK
jgi:hemolysin activation/secretion protein